MKNMKRIVLMFGLVAFALICQQVSATAKTVIAQNGKSTFTIVIAADAPQTVHQASEELQKDITLATGATLPVDIDSSVIKTPYISLGLTKQAKSAGLDTKNLQGEQFRILTKDGNVYIGGIDTADGKTNKNGGVSNGTANGVYRFLEDYLNVRWLMPGDIGRDVPPKSTFTLDQLDRIDGPSFNWRLMNHIINTKTQSSHYQSEVRQWATHLGVDTSGVTNSSSGVRWSDYGHNWTKTVPASLFKQHPDWFAMKNGKRVEPTGRYFLETTNPGLVRYFADKAIASFKKSKNPRPFALSASDSQGWSESPESKALYDPPAPGSDQPSMSSLMLKFYHDVAKIVQKEYPQGRLGGLIYSRYLQPPQKVSAKLPKNFLAVIAPSPYTYGYKLYIKENQKHFVEVMNEWGKIISGDWYYYDLPNQLLRTDPRSTDSFTGNTANVTPAAPEILNLVFHTMVDSHITGAYIYGDSSFSNSALANYLTAKMMWNPTADAYELQHQWLNRAYGEKAGEKMEAFYQKLNDLYRQYSQKQPISYYLTKGMRQDIYAAHFDELESLFEAAWDQPMTTVQKQRLQMIQENLIALRWRLDNAGLLDANSTSSLQRTDAQMAKILEATHPDIDYFPGVIVQDVPKFTKSKIKHIALAETVKNSGKMVLRDKSTFMIYAAKDGEIRITPQLVENGSSFATYVLQAKTGIVSRGLLQTDHPIEVHAKKGDVYYLYIARRPNIGYRLSIEGGAAAKSTFNTGSGTLSIQDSDASVYVYGDKNRIADVQDGVVFGNGPRMEMLQQLGLSWGKEKDAKFTNLDTSWRFSPVKYHSIKYSLPTYDDSCWSVINAGNWWQPQGFPNYRGVAWYRKNITLDSIEGRRVFLYFSAVDGTAQVFVNGKRVGTHFVAGADGGYKGWNEPFHFDTTKYMHNGENLVAVQVESKNLASTSSGMQGTVSMVVGDK